MKTKTRKFSSTFASISRPHTIFGLFVRCDAAVELQKMWFRTNNSIVATIAAEPHKTTFDCFRVESGIAHTGFIDAYTYYNIIVSTIADGTINSVLLSLYKSIHNYMMRIFFDVYCTRLCAAVDANWYSLYQLVYTNWYVLYRIGHRCQPSHDIVS